MNLRELWVWWWYDVRHPIGLIFLIYALIAGAQFGYAATLIPFFVAVIVGGIADALLIRRKIGAWGFPSSGLVTGSIVGLLTAHTLPLWLITLIVLIAIASKFIAWKGNHVFNPANFGMLMGIYFLGAQTTWWGAYSLIAVLLGGLFVVYRQRRWWVVVPFFATFFLLRLTAVGLEGAWIELTAPALIFFATIMLIEPRTSPTMKWPRLIYGILAGALVVVLATVPGDLHLALALANLSVPVLRHFFK